MWRLVLMESMEGVRGRPLASWSDIGRRPVAHRVFIRLPHPSLPGADHLSTSSLRQGPSKPVKASL